MRKMLLRVTAWLALVALLASCSTLPSNLETPELSLVGIQLTSGDMFAQKFKVRVLVKNPNEVELHVRGLDYQIILMGDRFATGESVDKFVLPAAGEAEFDMIVTTNFSSALGRLISRVGGGKLQDLDYEIVGNVMLDKGIVRKIPFSHQGKVDVSRTLGQKPGQI